MSRRSTSRVAVLLARAYLRALRKQHEDCLASGPQDEAPCRRVVNNDTEGAA